MTTFDCPSCGHRHPDADGQPDGELVCPACGATFENSAGRSEDPDRVAALMKARLPGMALIAVGGLWAIAGLACLGLALVLIGHMRGPRGINPGAAISVLAVAAVAVLFLIAIGAVIARGGVHLLQLHSQRRVIDGASTAIFFGAAGVALLFCGGKLLAAVPLMGIPIGIWTIVVMKDPIVVSAFDERSPDP